MKTLYVRVQPRSGQSTFHRCGIQFSKAWLKVTDIDAATAQRLEEEQMLEVSETKPADYEEPATNAADPAVDLAAAVVGSGTPAAAPDTGAAAAKLDAALVAETAPQDPLTRLVAIKAAIGQLDTSDPALFTAANKPKTEAIAAITGWPVTAAERDTALVVEGQQ